MFLGPLKQLYTQLIMDKIQLQEKTKAQKGTIELFWFENKNIGLQKTLFHRITIPLEPFNSGLEYEPQPTETKIVIDWLNLHLEEPTNLDGLDHGTDPEDETETSIYLGSAHNLCDIKRMSIKKIGSQQFQLDCELLVDFKSEGVAENEVFSFVTELELNPLIKEE